MEHRVPCCIRLKLVIPFSPSPFSQRRRLICNSTLYPNVGELTCCFVDKVIWSKFTQPSDLLVFLLKIYGGSYQYPNLFEYRLRQTNPTCSWTLYKKLQSNDYYILSFLYYNQYKNEKWGSLPYLYTFVSAPFVFVTPLGFKPGTF